MSHSLAGEPRAAATALLAAGERTMNMKLIDMARLVLQRHSEKIADAGALGAQADALRERFGSASMTAPMASDAGRQSGGVALRIRTPEAEATGVAAIEPHAGSGPKT